MNRDVIGLSASEARSIGKVTPADLKTIMLKLAEAVVLPNAFTNDALSLGEDGKSRSVFSPEAVRRDLLGWIIKISYDHFSTVRHSRKSIGGLVSMYIDSHIRIVSEEKLRLMLLGDAGPMYAARYLEQAALALDPDSLPKLFEYAKDYESEEDKSKRLAKLEERQARTMASSQAV